MTSNTFIFEPMLFWVPERKTSQKYLAKKGQREHNLVMSGKALHLELLSKMSSPFPAG